MTVIRCPISPVIFSPLRAPTALYKCGGGRVVHNLILNAKNLTLNSKNLTLRAQ